MRKPLLVLCILLSSRNEGFNMKENSKVTQKMSEIFFTFDFGVDGNKYEYR